MNVNVIVNRFFGIFFMFFQSGLYSFTISYLTNYSILGQVWGNLISYLILKPKERETNGTVTNVTVKYGKCGADFIEKEYKGTEVVNQIDRKTVKHEH